MKRVNSFRRSWTHSLGSGYSMPVRRRGKTTQVAALMHNRGTIVAVDRLTSRLQLVTENCRRLGVNTVMPLVGICVR